MSKTYSISITLTDEQDDQLRIIFSRSGKTVQDVLDQFVSGYLTDGQFQKGQITVQLEQWLGDEIKSKLQSMDSSTALSKLSKER